MDLLEAASLGNLRRVRALVEQHGRSVHFEALLGWTALSLADRDGHIRVARYLLDAGANINHRDNNGCTPVIEAAGDGRVLVLSLLLERGADVTVTTITEGMTALSFAAMHGRAACVRVLLKHGGIDVDIRDHYACTAIHRACSRGHAGVLKELLDAGADPLLRSGQGRTEAEVAAAFGHHDCVRVLQEWDRAYLLQRVRRVRDASSTPSTNTP